MTTILAQMVWP